MLSGICLKILRESGKGGGAVSDWHTEKPAAVQRWHLGAHATGMPVKHRRESEEQLGATALPWNSCPWKETSKCLLSHLSRCLVAWRGKEIFVLEPKYSPFEFLWWVLLAFLALPHGLFQALICLAVLWKTVSFAGKGTEICRGIFLWNMLGKRTEIFISSVDPGK